MRRGGDRQVLATDELIAELAHCEPSTQACG